MTRGIIINQEERGREKRSIKMSTNIPSWMIINSVRYIVGKATYQVALTTEWLNKNWDDIPSDTQSIIRHDVEEEFRRYKDGQDKALGNKGLPEQLLKDIWENVRKLWVNIPEEIQENQESDYE